MPGTATDSTVGVTTSWSPSPKRDIPQISLVGQPKPLPLCSHWRRTKALVRYKKMHEHVRHVQCLTSCLSVCARTVKHTPNHFHFETKPVSQCRMFWLFANNMGHCSKHPAFQFLGELCGFVKKKTFVLSVVETVKPLKLFVYIYVKQKQLFLILESLTLLVLGWPKLTLRMATQNRQYSNTVPLTSFILWCQVALKQMHIVCCSDVALSMHCSHRAALDWHCSVQT